MKGSAPNSPATGFQSLVRQKARPNFWSDSDESFASVTPIAMTISSSAAANTPMPTRNPRSEERTARLRDLDPVERRHLLHHDAGGEGRIPEIRRERLPLGQRPMHEIHHRLAGDLVLRILVHQDPGERRNRIR